MGKENRQHAVPWVAPSTLTQNLFDGAIAAHVSLLIIGRKPTSGGSSETEVNEPIVKPAGCSAPSSPVAMPVMIVTPVGKWPSTCRKWAESNSSDCTESDITGDLNAGSATGSGAMNVMKTELRAEMRRIRRSIVDGAGRVDALWTSVLAACRQLGARTVMAFVGVGSEPDTTGLIELLRSNGITVVLPRIEGDHIVGVVHAHGMNLAIGPFGIPAPTGSAIEPTTIDVVLLPGLAFTRDGRRLGQGGGFYDRFLPLLGPDATTIGVCFREQLVEQLVTEPHDRIVDLVISDDVRE